MTVTLEINGRRVEVDDGFRNLTPAQQEAFVADVARQIGAPQPQQTNAVSQLGSGLNEGMAAFAGLPVEAARGVINSMVQRPTFDTAVSRSADGGLDLNLTPTGVSRGVENPVGGIADTTAMMSPFIDQTAPQTTPQRYARRIGQELGFGVPTALATAAVPGAGAAARANLPWFMGASAASDIGAGVAGQTARNIAPESDTADLIASMIGGLTFGGAVAGAAPRADVRAPTIDDVKNQAARRWERVQETDATITPEAMQDLDARLRGVLTTNRATDTRLFPRANASVEEAAAMTDPTLYGVEQTRRFIGRNVAANADEASVGVALKKEIDDYLKTLTPEQMQGESPQEAVANLFAAREATSRVKKAESILNKEMRGETRAATSGSGGNEVNAQRQNIRTLFDTERDPTLSGRRQGFSPDEMDAMERVVMGTDASNWLRNVGKLSPTSGMLPMAITGIGGGMGLTGAHLLGNPALALPLIAGGVGMVSKGAAEQLTKRHIQDLMDTILLGGRKLPRTARNAAALGASTGLMTYPPQ